MTSLLCGVDPGEKTGWCLYDPNGKRVIEAGMTERYELSARMEIAVHDAEIVVIESMIEPRAGIYPQTVKSAIYEGRLHERIVNRRGIDDIELLSRHDAKLILTDATLNEVRAVDDKNVWRALCLLHGDGADRKAKVKKGVVVEPGGPLAGVRSHERAALAVAVAAFLKKGGQFK